MTVAFLRPEDCRSGKRPYASPRVSLSGCPTGSEILSDGNYPSPNTPCDCGSDPGPGNYPSPNSPCDCKPG